MSFALDLKTSAMFLDVDGTLVDIAPAPGAVAVASGLVQDLALVFGKLDGALALVSGRTIAALDTFFQPLMLPAAGAHGAELRLSPGPSAIVPAGEALSPGLRRKLIKLGADAGLVTEDKGVSVALHYRGQPTIAERLRAAIADLLAAEDDPALAILDGHCVFEAKRSTYDKGTAVHAFMANPPFTGRRPVFIGDDITDESAFATVAALEGTGLSVGRPFPSAHMWFENAAEVRAWLTALAGRPENAA